MSTTLVARHAETGERLTIGDAPLELLRTLSDTRLLRCENCGGSLTLKAGTLRIHHFAHVNLDTCAAPDYEPETDTHREGKLLLYRHFRRGAREAAIERHLPNTDQRADVYIEMPGGSCYALEFQQANNTAEHWSQRHMLYAGIGLHDIWFLGQIRYQESRSEPLRPISPYDPSRVPRREYEAAAGAFRIREMERAILASMEGYKRLYYLDSESGMLTILLAREVHHQTLRAYRYRLPLESCTLRAGGLWTPLDALLLANDSLPK